MENQTTLQENQLKTKNEIPTERELYTDKEAADFLRCSTVSLWRARKKGLITFRRVMGRVLYTKTDLTDFLNRCKRGGFSTSLEDIS